MDNAAEERARDRAATGSSVCRAAVERSGEFMEGCHCPFSLIRVRIAPVVRAGCGVLLARTARLLAGGVDARLRPSHLIGVSLVRLTASVGVRTYLCVVQYSMSTGTVCTGIVYVPVLGLVPILVLPVER